MQWDTLADGSGLVHLEIPLSDYFFQMHRFMLTKYCQMARQVRSFDQIPHQGQR
jgi:hypothetical protein